MEKTVEYYLGLPYTLELQNDPEAGWFAHVKELPGCMSQADTAEEALASLKEVMPLWFETAIEDGATIPEPRPEEDYSGKFVVRVPRSLHRELVEAAEADGVSLNQYINVALGKEVGREAAVPSHAAAEEFGWPGLRLGVRQALIAAGLSVEAGELDERLFAQWVEDTLAQVEAAVTGGYDRDALTYLDGLQRALSVGVAHSAALQVFVRTAALLRHQVAARHEAERKALDPLRILARVTDAAEGWNTRRDDMFVQEEQLEYVAALEQALPDASSRTLLAALRQTPRRQR